MSLQCSHFQIVFMTCFTGWLRVDESKMQIRQSFSLLEHRGSVNKLII